MKRSELIQVGSAILTGLYANKDTAMYGEETIAKTASEGAAIFINEIDNLFKKKASMTKSMKAELKRIISELEELNERLDVVNKADMKSLDKKSAKAQESGECEEQSERVLTMSDTHSEIEGIIETLKKYVK